MQTQEERAAYNKAYHEANKEAHNADSRDYNKAHKEEKAAYNKSYREANREEIAAYAKAYHKANTAAHNANCRAYHKSNKEAHNADSRAYYASHKEEIAAYNKAHKEEIKAYLKKRKGSLKAYHRSYHLANLQKFRAKSARYRATQLDQTPDLSEDENQAIAGIYKQALRLNSTFGANTFHVDHTIPLSMGGLHHPNNLQVVPSKWNLSKSNNNSERWEVPFTNCLTISGNAQTLTNNGQRN